MIEKEEGIIVFLKKIKDNDIFIKILSNSDELVSGMVYGGNSSKKKLTYQIGYFIEYSIVQKNKNIVPTFKADIIKPFISSIINDKYKSYSLLCIVSLVNLSIIEGQKINEFYKSVKDVVKILESKKHWISFFCEWLFKLLQLIGYQIDYKNNKGYKYFNLITQDFENSIIENSIIENSIAFPHEMLTHRGRISFKELNSIFTIFESIYIKNHLDNINYKMPISFINFKKSLLSQLKK